MKFPELKEALERLNALRAELKAVFDEAGPDRDMTKVKSLNGDSQAKVDWIRAKNAEIEEAKDKVDNLRELEKGLVFSAQDPEVIEGDGHVRDAKPMSLGQRFIASDAFKEFRGGIGPIATLDLDVRNTLFQTTAGWAPESTRTGVIDLSPERPLRVVDFIPTLPTTQNSIKFMRETTFTASAVVEKAEGTAFGEAALALTEKSQTVEKIPAFIPVTDEQLEDEQAAAAYLDQRLIYMVKRRLDGQCLTGTGVSPLLLGTENVTGIQTQALGADSIPDAIYKLFVSIRDDADASGGDAEPSVVFIRPTKWQTVRLLTTADGIYIWGPPSDTGPQRIWGVPVVLTNAPTATVAVTGDYAMHSALYVRSGVDVQISNSHSTYFVEGKQAIRATLRVAMVHFRPSAFGTVTGL